MTLREMLAPALQPVEVDSNGDEAPVELPEAAQSYFYSIINGKHDHRATGM